MKSWAVAVALSALFVAVPASAADYLFTISGASTASGTLTVQDPVIESGGSLITAISGIYNGQQITGLIPVGGWFGNDNRLFVGQTPVLDGNGFSFTDRFGSHNMYYLPAPDSPVNPYVDLGSGRISFSISPITAAVPEPSTWALMLIGFGAIGYGFRRRQKAPVRNQAA